MPAHIGSAAASALYVGTGEVTEAYLGTQNVYWSPKALFRANEAGVWYDPSDFSTLFQDSAGTTPVTALGQPVGLVLDKSRGLTLGAELVTNGNFSSPTTTGWVAFASATLTVNAERLQIQNNAGNQANCYATYPVTTIVGRSYLLSVAYDANATGLSLNIYPAVNTSGAPLAGTTAVTGSGVRNVYFTATGTTSFVLLQALAMQPTQAVFFDNISVREVPGTHLIQPTAASRPTVQARSNVLIRSEEFDTSTWAKTAATISANAATAPDGTTTADKLLDNTTNTEHRVAQTFTSPGSVTYTYSVYAKASELSWLVVGTLRSNLTSVRTFFDVSAGTIGNIGADHTATITSVGNGWFRCTVTGTPGATASATFVIATASANGTNSYAGTSTDGILIWGAQLEQASSATTYQRVTTATNYADIGLPRYLQFDGVDDSLFTAANLALTGTDKVSVFAGVTRLQDATAGLVCEHSTDYNTNIGSLYVLAPENSTRGYSTISRGTASVNTLHTAFVTGTPSAPDTAVVTASHDIAGSLSTIRRNAVAGTDGTLNKGAGNFGNYVFYVGRRNNASLPLNGRIYPLILRGALTDPTTLAQAEQWVAGKTGVVLP